MALQRAVQGATKKGQEITWLDSDDQPEDLTGAVITGLLKSSATNETRAITGALTITDEEGGVFTWAYSAADVAAAGTFQIQFTANYSGVPLKTFVGDWIVERSLPDPA